MFLVGNSDGRFTTCQNKTKVFTLASESRCPGKLPQHSIEARTILRGQLGTKRNFFRQTRSGSNFPKNQLLLAVPDFPSRPCPHGSNNDFFVKERGERLYPECGSNPEVAKKITRPHG